MPIEIRTTPLMQFLDTQKSPYHGKVFELREAISGWLSYIPATFPHYTRHTIEHSEEIISQMSNILFIDGDHLRPVLRDLSSLEAYILIAAAYLHDAGMTVSDDEKRSILQSSDWREWVEEGGGAARFNEINAFRESKSGALNDTTRSFLADVQLRFLIAEFVRRSHHLRGGDILTLHQAELGRFGYDDSKLIRAISSVCVAHGLRQSELNDPNRFPDTSIIRGERVNVRLLAVLLRLGDLLDMSTDRACPLLLNAASPLPAGSMAHWTQYNRISLISVEHDKIILNAECENQDEHRFLHDWCSWLVSELDQAQRLMARSRRHVGWLPPVATIDQVGSTINIQPAPGANYIPAQWRFELDIDAVFDRLVYDALDTPWDFLRELIQNSADASRCRMFDEVKNQSGSKPLYPTQVAEDIREAYPIQITLDTIQIRNEMSGEAEERQILTVEDEGLGMDSDIIQKYLLQVGRSYYTTRNFRENFGFIASSRFGVGFLSVFGVSNDVTIETYKPSSTIDTTPLRLRLTGPKSYLLIEKGTRRRPGTTIQLVLRNPTTSGEITGLVRNWCARLEFPVVVNDLGNKSEIRAEQAESFVSSIKSATNENAKLVVRSFPIDRDGIEGSLFVLAHMDEEGERWDKSKLVKEEIKDHPQAIDLLFPENAIFFHGIDTVTRGSSNWDYGMDRNFSHRIDLRGERFNPALTRSEVRFRSSKKGNLPEIQSRWDEILREHMPNNDFASLPLWAYKQCLSEDVGSTQFWLKEPGTIPIMQNGTMRTISLQDTDKIEYLTIFIPKSQYAHNTPKRQPDLPYTNNTVILDNWVSNLKRTSVDYIFSKRNLVNVEVLQDFISATWFLTSEAEELDYLKLFIKPFSADCLGTQVNRISSPHGSRPYVLNSNHPFISWYLRVKEACKSNQYGLSEIQATRLRTAIYNALGYGPGGAQTLNSFLIAWCKIPSLPSDLIPPATILDKSQIVSVEY